jgi:hypothetical protein
MFPNRPGLISLVLLAGAAALAQAEVTITCDPDFVCPGGTCILDLRHEDGRDHHWEWSTLNKVPATFDRNPSGPGWIFRAPGVLLEDHVTVRVSDGLGTSRTHRIRVVPATVLPRKSPGAEGLATVRYVPGLAPFVPEIPYYPVRAGLEGADIPKHLAFIFDPAAGSLHGQYLLAVSGDLYAVSPEGALNRLNLKGELASGIPVPCGDDYRTHKRFLLFTALAPRPAASEAGNPLHTVVAVNLLQDQQWLGEFLCQLQEDGTLRPLLTLAAGPEAKQTYCGMLVQDPLGNLIMAESTTGLIHRLAPGGKPERLAGRSDRVGKPGRDGQGAEASFGRIEAITLDPATGRLYVLDTNCVRSVAPDGTVATLFGRLEPGDEADREGGSNPDPAGSPIKPGQPCLNNPRSLCFQDGTLFLSDRGNHGILAYHLNTQVLRTLLGAAGDRELVYGPLRSSGVPRPFKGFAAVPLPDCLVVQGSTCVVGSGHRLVRFELPACVREPEAIHDGTASSFFPVLANTVLYTGQESKEEKRADPPADLAPDPRPDAGPAWGIKAGDQLLRGGQSLELTVVPQHSAQTVWRWAVLGQGSFSGQGSLRTVYTAPEVKERRKVIIHASTRPSAEAPAAPRDFYFNLMVEP